MTPVATNMISKKLLQGFHQIVLMFITSISLFWDCLSLTQRSLYMNKIILLQGFMLIISAII